MKSKLNMVCIIKIHSLALRSCYPRYIFQPSQELFSMILSNSVLLIFGYEKALDFADSFFNLFFFFFFFALLSNFKLTVAYCFSKGNLFVFTDSLREMNYSFQTLNKNNITFFNKKMYFYLHVKPI